MSPDDLPLLGEPAPVEFANTLYFSGRTSTDFIASPSLLRLWVTHVKSDPPLPAPGPWAPPSVRAAGELRDAVRQLFEALALGRAPPVRALRVINQRAAAVATHVELSPRLTAVTRSRGEAPLDTFLGRMAIDTIVLAASLKPGQLRRCGGPGCAMLFIRDRHRRQWCHESCGHRARQASYYRRKVAAQRRRARR